MTSDERQEIGLYLRMIRTNIEELLRSVIMAQEALGKIECEKNKITAKEDFLRNY